MYDDFHVYNMTTGVFRAPVDGLYHFDLVVYNVGGGSQGLWLGIADSPAMMVRVEAGMDGYTMTYGKIAMPVSTNLLMSEGDEIVAFFRNGVDAINADAGGQDPERLRTMQFSGHLVAPFDVSPFKSQ